MADTVSTIYKNYTFRGTLQLRKKPNQNSEAVNPYVMPVDAVVTILFPGMSLNTTDGDVTIADANLSTVTFICPLDKAALLTTGNGAAVDAVVDSALNETSEAFEALKVYDIKVLKNA